MAKNEEAIRDHLMNHQTYPATKQEILEECNKLSDVEDKDKEMFEKLPDKTYNSAEEVMEAMGMKETA